MRVMLVLVLTLFYLSNARSESLFYSNNKASIGKIIINGKEFGGSDATIKGSGVKQTVSREIQDFLSVNSHGGFDIKYRHGPPSLTISGDDNIINHVLTKIVDKTLQISINKSYSSENSIDINISSPIIKSIRVNGTSHVELDAIKAEKLKINVLGSVDLIANGNSSQLEIEVHGASDVKARALSADFVTVIVFGTGDVEVTASKELDAKVTGVGDILYFGRPKKITKKISGVGDIESGD